MRTWGLLFTLLLSMCFNLSAQKVNDTVISPGQRAAKEIGLTLFAGNIIRHKKSLRYEQPKLLSGFEVEWKTKDKDIPWRSFWKYPELTHHFHFNSFGNKDQLGVAIAYYPTLSFKLLKTQRWKLAYQMGTGLSYVSKPFSAFENNDNNGIGSRINNITQIRFDNKIELSNSVVLNTGLQVIHYSNGGTKSPNSGINALAGYVGIKYHFESVEDGDRAKIDHIGSQEPKYKLDFYTGVAFREVAIDGSPTFLIPNIYLGYIWNIASFYKINTGLLFEYDFSRYQFAQNQYFSEKDSNAYARSLSLMVHNELIFGDIFVRLSIGTYLPFNFTEREQIIQTQLGIFYTLPIKLSKGKIYTGVGIKSHKFVADYLSLFLGYQF